MDPKEARKLLNMSRDNYKESAEMQKVYNTLKSLISKDAGHLNDEMYGVYVNITKKQADQLREDGYTCHPDLDEGYWVEFPISD